MNRWPFYLLCGLLIAVGLALMSYRHISDQVPWLPGTLHKVWSLEARVSFEAEGEPVKVSLAIPDTQPGFRQLNEFTASPGYGLSFVSRGQGRRAEWAIRRAEGQQTLYYRVNMLAAAYSAEGPSGAAPRLEPLASMGEPYDQLALEMLKLAHARSADAPSLTQALIEEFNNRSQQASLLYQRASRNEWLVNLLNHAGTPARRVQALLLEDGRRRQELVDFIQVFAGERYFLFDPQTASQPDPQSLLLWQYHDSSLLDVTGGNNSRVSFSIIEQELPANQLVSQDRENLLSFSLYSLPIDEQALFKGILLIPVGVLVVLLMRILVGVRTSGTFMPVLIAMAFIQTSLTTGLVGFILIVATGLYIRAYLSHLNLLLVARISVVIMVVIGIITVFAVAAYQLGLTQGLKVTFFPMVILAWTIERMSLLWEEEGPSEVFKQGGGSLLVAVVAYLAMDNALVRHITFNFLGFQLILMAVALLAGGYTGYRLLELKRFKPLRVASQ